jgi:ribose transport system substrate-binding protein
MNSKKFVPFLMALIMAMSAILTACSGQPAATAAPTAAPQAAAPTTAPAAAQPTAAPAQPAATQAPAKAAEFKPVWYAPAPHPYFEDVRKGVEAFEKDYGVTVEKQIGPDWKQDSQNQNMEALAAKGFNAFAVYPADASGANGLYEELTAKGIKIINFGTTTAQPTTASFAVATDVKAAAMEATERLITAMGGKGNIINVLEVLEDPNTVLRKQGVDEVVAKHPDVKIIQEVSGMKSTEEAVQKVGDALAANADKVDGILATGYTPTVAIAQVLTEYKTKGGNRTIHAVGIDTDPVVMQAIKDGVMDGTIVQNPYGHAYLSLLLLLYMDMGYKPQPGVYFVNAGFAYANKDNLTTYSQDILKVTEQIKGDLLTKYLTK